MVEKHLVAGLKADGRRLTRTRKAVFEALEDSTAPVTAAELHRQLTRQGTAIDLVTVYRTLTVLKELELVAQVEFGEGQFRYEVRHGREHHHHIRCRGCGQIVDLMLCPLKKLTALVERQTQFLVESHNLEFTGMCPKCR